MSNFMASVDRENFGPNYIDVHPTVVLTTHEFDRIFQEVLADHDCEPSDFFSSQEEVKKFMTEIALHVASEERTLGYVDGNGLRNTMWNQLQTRRDIRKALKEDTAR